MCVVSMVTDVAMHRWPEPIYPIGINSTDYTWLKELIRKAEEYDRLNNQPDCPSDDKKKWLDKFNSNQITSGTTS